MSYTEAEKAYYQEPAFPRGISFAVSQQVPENMMGYCFLRTAGERAEQAVFF